MKRKVCLSMLILSMAIGTTVYAAEADNAAPVVDVTGGTIQGYVDENGVKTFKGIPFAATTEGENRFKAPQPVENWEGVRECTEYGPIAMQAAPNAFGPWTEEYVDAGKTYENGEMSEDCLNLNVWTTAEAGEKKPVIVYIHGGGNSSGSGECEIYTGEDIAQKGVVYVSINYRVGLFGFLAYKDSTGEEVTGNLGIQDQIAALKWVKENIAEFGGDPDNITIAGQSAGSSNCQTLITSPAAEGLFQKAVCMSFTPNDGVPASLEEAEAAAAEKLGDVTLEDLRSMSSKEVQELTATYNPTSTCIDDTIVTQGRAEAFANGDYNKVDLMWGGVTGDTSLFGTLQIPDDDGNPFTPVLSLTPDQYKTAVQDSFGEKAERCMELYPVDETKDNVIDATGVINEDGLLARYYNASVQKDTVDPDHKTYVYYFSHPVADTEERMAENGAFHTGDVGYWLNHFTTTYERPWQQEDYDLGEVMSSYLVNFASTSDPNGTDSNGNALPEWKDIAQTDGISYMSFDTDAEWTTMDADKSEFWTE